ncbi:MAG: alpha/beta hydrolase [Alphaproteobacteria bacterium]|nr:alpha/beta hydrolase [Rhizobiaceae bacterium]MBU3960594.1 alpha/beta hydrolase [Alphaproteobacteria bacterium]MBU4049668.1 alpha/beta hydrolase [Alphaproteobacteria bacterium]MBU4090964.1 alpha/beta hydrolase [Alphaproteobacteria bacterium]MBU4154975.1 alpha/beta hydrolase [Alphaproteobacteria bacterium]
MQMSTAHFRKAAVLCGLLGAFAAGPARAEALQPFKDALFSQPIVLESRDGGDFEVIDYQELRDINGRDQIPERRVKSKYVDLGVKRQQANETLQLPSGNLEVARVGKADGAAFTVIFIHGRGGDRRLGINDFSFGGNFNRLKNLAVRNGGVYYAPSVPSFDAAGVTAISGLIAHAAARAPGRPVVLACASMGSFICWGVARDAQTVSHLAGLAILGGATDPSFVGSAAHKARLPVFFTHGSRDSVYASADQIALYDRLHKAGYPTRFSLFETGAHGTPVRMSDWRSILNWLLMAR